MQATVRLDYDFKIAGTVVGSYVLENDGAVLRQRTQFVTPAGELYDNEHVVRYRGPRVLAYQASRGTWVDCMRMPDDHYPTSAYPLLLRHRAESYRAIDEGTGAVTVRTLDWAESSVVERQDATQVRRFDLRDGLVVEIDWGGATSSLLAHVA